MDDLRASFWFINLLLMFCHKSENIVYNKFQCVFILKKISHQWISTKGKFILKIKLHFHELNVEEKSKFVHSAKTTALYQPIGVSMAKLINNAYSLCLSSLSKYVVFTCTVIDYLIARAIPCPVCFRFSSFC